MNRKILIKTYSSYFKAKKTKKSHLLTLGVQLFFFEFSTYKFTFIFHFSIPLIFESVININNLPVLVFLLQQFEDFPTLKEWKPMFMQNDHLFIDSCED